MRKMISYSPVDAACDQMAVQYQRDTLPPALTEGQGYHDTVSASLERGFNCNRSIPFDCQPVFSLLIFIFVLLHFLLL